MSALELTPAALRALGEGVQRLRDGDLDDCAQADRVVESMKAMGYRLGGYTFIQQSRFELIVDGVVYATRDDEADLADLMETAWRSPDRSEPTRFEVWDFDQGEYREDLVKSNAPPNYFRQEQAAEDGCMNEG